VRGAAGEVAQLRVGERRRVVEGEDLHELAFRAPHHRKLRRADRKVHLEPRLGLGGRRGEEEVADAERVEVLIRDEAEVDHRAHNAGKGSIHLEGEGTGDGARDSSGGEGDAAEAVQSAVGDARRWWDASAGDSYRAAVSRGELALRAGGQDIASARGQQAPYIEQAPLGRSFHRQHAGFDTVGGLVRSHWLRSIRRFLKEVGRKRRVASFDNLKSWHAYTRSMFPHNTGQVRI